ncbi:MAG: hypothetical protein HOP32_14435 [Nitrospira sp.]|nr:hypothetical protein [Nitrospira sp.]
MESTKSEFEEACDKFEGAAERELELARQEQAGLYKLGQAHNAEVRLSSQLRGGASLNMASPDMEELLRLFNGQKQALNDQQAMVAMRAAALDRTRTDKKEAAEQVAEHYRSLVMQAHAMLKQRYGKTPSRFALWGNVNEAEMAWRVVTLNQLLCHVQNRVPGSITALRHLLSGDTFRIRVMRGSFVRMDNAMKEIRPTTEYHIPKDMPARDAFEAVLTGRAELAAYA